MVIRYSSKYITNMCFNSFWFSEKFRDGSGMALAHLLQGSRLILTADICRILYMILRLQEEELSLYKRKSHHPVEDSGFFISFNLDLCFVEFAFHYFPFIFRTAVGSIAVRRGSIVRLGSLPLLGIKLLAESMECILQFIA